MLIDWFTVIAQIINFLILLFLLRRFLYGPIINAMHAREERVVARLEDAHRQQEEAEQEAADYRRQQRELEQQRAARLQEAEESAHARREELIAEARAETDRLRANWHAALEQSKESFLRDLRQRTGEQVTAIARRVLNDLATADLEQQIIRAFLQRLRSLDQATQATIAQATADAQPNVLIRSAFDLSHDQRRQIENTVQAQFGEEVELSFETAPELIAGIALTVGSHELAWNLQSYLETLEEEIDRIFAEETQAGQAAPEAQPDSEGVKAERELVEEHNP